MAQEPAAPAAVMAPTTLRDWFAGVAAAAMTESHDPEMEFDEEELEQIADDAYRLADALIKRRAKR